MGRMQAIEPQGASGKAKLLLDQVQRDLGMTPNVVRVLANAPQALEGYLGLSGALAQGVLPVKLREQLALVVAETNGCDYCLAAHGALGKMVGLSEQDVSDARQGNAVDRRTEAALKFARKLVDQRGQVSDSDVARLRQMGFGDDALAEIIAHVALNTFTNYFNHVASTEVDFPPVDAQPRVAG